MDREEVTKWLTIIKANLNSFPEVSKAKKIGALDEAIRLLKNEQSSSSEISTGYDCISRTDALRVAKNEYLRGWHNALCKALSEKYSIHCEEGNFSVIQEETITGLGLSMNCAVGKDVESYMSTIPSVTPIKPRKGEWCKQNDDYFDWYECSECGYGSEGEMQYSSEYDVRTNFCPNCGADMRGEEE